jgi:hypothetical protein
MFFSGCASTPEKHEEQRYEKAASPAANQTLNYAIHWVDKATLRVLDQMEIMIIDNHSLPTGNSIKAATLDLDILIELETLTPNSTKMKINIQNPNDSKSKLTVNEIFYNTRQYLLSHQIPEKHGVNEPLNHSQNFIVTISSRPSQF